MKGIWVLIMLILCSSTVFSSLSVDIGDNSIPYVGINPVLTYGVLDSDNVWTGDNTFLNVTIINQSILNINSTICLNSSCISSWSDVNGSNYVLKTGDTMTGNLTIDDGTNDKELRIESGINGHSYLYLMENDIFGFRLWYDGSGTNQFKFDAIDNGVIKPQIWFDRDTGDIDFFTNLDLSGNNLTADYFIGSGAFLSELNISGRINGGVNSSFGNDTVYWKVDQLPIAALGGSVPILTGKTDIGIVPNIGGMANGLFLLDTDDDNTIDISAVKTDFSNSGGLEFDFNNNWINLDMNTRIGDDDGNVYNLNVSGLVNSTGYCFGDNTCITSWDDVNTSFDTLQTVTERGAFTNVSSIMFGTASIHTNITNTNIDFSLLAPGLILNIPIIKGYSDDVALLGNGKGMSIESNLGILQDFSEGDTPGSINFFMTNDSISDNYIVAIGSIEYYATTDVAPRFFFSDNIYAEGFYTTDNGYCVGGNCITSWDDVNFSVRWTKDANDNLYTNLGGNISIGSTDTTQAGFYINMSDGAGKTNTILISKDSSVSNNNSVVIGGVNLISKGFENTLIGGNYNRNYGNETTMIGGAINTINESVTTCAGIIFGTANTLIGDSWDSAMIGGFNNTMNDSGHSAIIGGDSNYLNSWLSSIITSVQSISEGYISSMVSTSNSYMWGITSFMGGGYNNTLISLNSGMIGGSNNTIYGFSSFIGGGHNLTVTGDDSVAFGKNKRIDNNATVGIGGNLEVDSNVTFGSLSAATGTDYICIDSNGMLSNGDTCTTFEIISNPGVILNKNEFQITKIEKELYPSDHPVKANELNNYYYTVAFEHGGKTEVGIIKVPRTLSYDDEILYYLKMKVENYKNINPSKQEVVDSIIGKTYDLTKITTTTIKERLETLIIRNKTNGNLSVIIRQRLDEKILQSKIDEKSFTDSMTSISNIKKS